MAEANDLDVSVASAEGDGLAESACNEMAQFLIRAPGLPATALRLSMEGPSRAELKVANNMDSTYTGTYTPTQPGDYKLSVTFGGKHIPGSPFTIKVSGEGVKGDSTKVQLVGSAFKEGRAGQMNEFQVDTKEAGFCKVQVSVQGPAKCELKCENVKTNLFAVGYKPMEAGTYQLSVRFSGDHVPGSPFIIKVGSAKQA